jgi:hypothetical protein
MYFDRASGRKGKWTADEDSKQQDAVQTHDGENWGAATALVPGRTECTYKLKDAASWKVRSYVSFISRLILNIFSKC